MVADLNEEAAEALAGQVVADGGQALALRCDVSSEADVTAVVERCAADLGSVDVMVNNAGVTRDASMRNMTLEDFGS